VLLHKTASRVAAVTLSLLILGGCADEGSNPAAPGTEVTQDLLAKAADGHLAIVEDMVFWPWTAAAPIAPVDEARSDPINVIFVGEGADARTIRAALMTLPLERPTPLGADFGCTWNDAIGSVQLGYAEPGGWQGAAIQLQCGDYDPLRFHLRLYDMGEYTLGAVHWDLLITGTTDHQVLSWETAEQLLLADLIYGLGWGPVAPPAEINKTEGDWFRTIPAMIYGLLPPELTAVLDAVPGVDAEGSYGIANDGVAMIIGVPAGELPEDAVVIKRDLTIQFDQMIPKPFCATPTNPYVYVTGPVHFKQHTVATPSGKFLSTFHATGHLELTPFAPQMVDGEPQLLPSGKTYKVMVNEKVKGIVLDKHTLTSTFTMRFELPQKGPERGKLFLRGRVGPEGVLRHTMKLDC
jgi:hypothetical protein